MPTITPPKPPVPGPSAAQIYPASPQFDTRGTFIISSQGDNLGTNPPVDSKVVFDVTVPGAQPRDFIYVRNIGSEPIRLLFSIIEPTELRPFFDETYTPTGVWSPRVLDWEQ